MYYSANGVTISRDPDQYSTDFKKAMNHLTSLSTDPQQDVIVLCTLGGRVDQGLGLLHEMYREHKSNPNVRLWLFSECSVSFLLRKGQNRIYARTSSGCFTENVGIVPLYGAATVTTTGLEWDITDWETKLGEQVSTSNHVVQDVVTIYTSAEVLFTIEIAR